MSEITQSNNNFEAQREEEVKSFSSDIRIINCTEIHLSTHWCVMTLSFSQKIIQPFYSRSIEFLRIFGVDEQNPSLNIKIFR
jgi:hypothetical protein